MGFRLLARPGRLPGSPVHKSSVHPGFNRICRNAETGILAKQHALLRV
jgi:hypothetical protein